MTTPNTNWFTNARFGMFVHYGLYSMLERGEWVMNRERISPAQMREIAKDFTAENFNADEICDLAVEMGARYVNLTTMHHDGFHLYDSQLTDFNSKAVCGRDLVEEFVAAARKRDLRISLYHSLNNWSADPDGVAALESKDAYEAFIANTHSRIKELVTRFNPIDVLWYDGWWPFNAEGWRAVEMNEMARAIQPNILVNGRNGLPGDFGTPEGHMSAPSPWRPWEACMTLNNNWGYHRGDQNWKSPMAVIKLLATAAQGQGNLLLNIGPKGDGSIPQPTVDILRAVGSWLKKHGRAIYDTDMFTFDLMQRGNHNSDWNYHGPMTRSGNSLFQFLANWLGGEITLAGFNSKATKVQLLTTGEACNFTQDGERITITGLPADPPDPYCPVLEIEFEDEPEVYLTGGMRVPNAPHPPYDPIQSDIQH